MVVYTDSFTLKLMDTDTVLKYKMEQQTEFSRHVLTMLNVSYITQYYRINKYVALWAKFSLQIVGGSPITKRVLISKPR